eukprot:3972330-Amphidinium_carterae.1
MSDMPCQDCETLRLHDMLFAKFAEGPASVAPSAGGKQAPSHIGPSHFSPKSAKSSWHNLGTGSKMHKVDFRTSMRSSKHLS